MNGKFELTEKADTKSIEAKASFSLVDSSGKEALHSIRTADIKEDTSKGFLPTLDIIVIDHTDGSVKKGPTHDFSPVLGDSLDCRYPLDI